MDHFLWMYALSIAKLLQALTKEGNKAYFVGGCVRDSLISKKFTDVDIAVDCTPDITQRLLKSENIISIPTGIQYGTVTALIYGKNFEITSTRKDVNPSGRDTKVVYTKNLLEDAKRRDFTFNAIYYDTQNHQLIDFFDGYYHLRQGRVIFIGDPEDRIQEDYLRILRYFRFFAHYSKIPMDERSLKACIKYKENLLTLSSERITKEIKKLLEAPNPSQTLKIMSDAGILEILGMEYPKNIDVLHNPHDRFIIFNAVKCSPKIILTRKEKKLLRLAQITSYEELLSVHESFIGPLTEIFKAFHKKKYATALQAISKCPITYAQIRALGYAGESINENYKKVMLWFMEKYVQHGKLMSMPECITYINNINEARGVKQIEQQGL